MAKHIVYRLEDKNGGGIFRSYKPKTQMSYARFLDSDFGKYWHPDIHRHPLPTLDKPLSAKLSVLVDPNWMWNMDEIAPWMIFGFSNIKQFRHWFYKKDWRMKLTMLGIRLNKYVVEEDAMVKGETQVVFDRRRATLVDSKTPMYRDC